MTELTTLDKINAMLKWLDTFESLQPNPSGTIDKWTRNGIRPALEAAREQWCDGRKPDHATFIAVAAIITPLYQAFEEARR